MNVALSSIKRPIFVASITVMLLVIGWISYKNMGVDLFPESRLARRGDDHRLRRRSAR